MNRSRRPRFATRARSGLSGSADRPEDRPTAHTPSLTPTWAAHIGSMHMMQPQNVINTSTGRAPIVNLTFNDENASASRFSHDFEPVVEARADHEIYYQQLLTKKRGSPLWVPGPGMQHPVEYRRQGVSIGDVGIITSIGEFDFLFNIFQPANHPINIGFVPQTFSPLPRGQLERDIQKTRVYGPNSYLASSSVRKLRGSFNVTSPVDQTFEITSGEAAILTMPDGASSQNLMNTSQIRQCISDNAQNWYEYVRNVRGRNVKNGDIRVVVGIDKVKTWGIATSACNVGQTASLTFKLENHPRFYHWDCTGGSGRVGPEEIEIIDLMQNNTIPQNQCAFVRTMNFTLSGEISDGPDSVTQPVSLLGKRKRQDSRTVNKGDTGRHTSGRKGTSSSPQTSFMMQGNTLHSMTSVTFNPMEHGVDYHPSAALHAYLHQKFPEARMVITQDSDLISVLNDDDILFPKSDVLVERILKSSNPSESDGIVTICMKPGVNPKVPPQITALHRMIAPKKGHLERKHTVVQPQEMPIRHSTQYTSTPAFVDTPRSQCVFPIISKASIATHSQSFTSPLLLLASTSTVEIDSDPEKWPINFNNDIRKELDVQLLHTLGYRWTIDCVKFSPDGKYLAVGGMDGVCIYDAQTGILTRALRNLLARYEHITTMSFTDKYLATGSPDGDIYIWEINNKYIRNAFKGYTSWISLNFSPDGRLLVSASYDNTVRLWSMRDGAAKLLTKDNPTCLPSPCGRCFTSAIFTPDGRYAAASHSDGSLRIWVVRTGQLMKRMQAHMTWVNDIAVMTHGLGLMTGRADTSPRWDVSSLHTTRFHAKSQTVNDSDGDATEVEETRIFLSHEEFAYSVSISPNGRWIASGSDNTVRIWDTRNAAMQCILNHARVVTVAFSPAGRYLASGADEGTVRIWRYN